MTLFASWWWNRSPDGTDVTRTINEGSPYAIKVADFGFHDADIGQTFAGVRIDSLPGNGRLLFNGAAVTAGLFITTADITAGKLVFAPDANESGNNYAAFNFSVKDSAGAFDVCANRFCFNVCPVNDAPDAVNDKASTLINTAVTVDVKANDSDPDNTRAELKVTQAVLANPAQGTVTINADGTVTFKPAAGITGPVEITYTLKDPGGLSDTAKVTIDVLAPPPGKQCLEFDFSGSKPTDGPDGNILTYTLSNVSVNVSAFAREDATGAWSKAYVGAYGGGLGVTDNAEGTGANNTHTVDNAGGRDNYLLFEFNQQVVLDKAFLGYVVCDSDLQVWIGNVAGAFDNHITLSDAALSSLGFTEVNTTTLTTTRTADLNAGEVAGNVIVIAADTTAQVIKGTTNLIVNGSFEEGTAASYGQYATLPGWTGNGDKIEVATAATYGVTGATGNRVMELDANTTCTVTGVYQNVATAAGKQYELSLDVAARNCTPNSTNTVEVWWRGAKIATIEPSSTALKTYTFLVTGSGGNDRLEFREQAGDDNSLGGIIDNVRMVTVTTVGDALDDYFKLEKLKVCTVVADTPPEGTDAVRTIAEDGSYTVLAADFGFSDADAGQTLKAVRIDSLPGNGTLTLNGVAVTLNQLIEVAAINAGQLRIAPDADENGSPYASFNFSVQDSANTFDTAPNTFTLNVTAVNDGPVARPDTATTPEDTPVSGNVLTNDADVDNATLTVTGFSVGGTDYAAGDTATLAGVGTLTIGADGTWTFTPAANYNGPVPQAAYTVTDGTASASSTLDITIQPVNDAPVAAPDTATTPEDTPVSGNVLGNDSDVDNDTLTVTGFNVGGVDHAAGDTAVLAGVGTLVITATGEFTFTPAANYNGPVPQATYTVTDGALTASATLDISVTPVNDTPVAAPDTATTPEDTPVSGNVLANDSDADAADTLKVTGFTVGGVDHAAGDTADLPGVGTLTIGLDGAWTFTPAANYNGPVPQATYTVSDGTATATATLDITVTPANDAPVAAPDVASTPEDTPVSGNVLTNDSDVDNDALTVTGFSIGGTDYAPGATADLPGVGTLVVRLDGTWTFTPAANFNGAVPQATYTVTDGTATASSTLSIDVGTINDTPVAAPDTATTPEDTPVSGNVLANDSDADAADTLKVTGFTVGGVDHAAGDTADLPGVGTLTIGLDGAWTFTPAANYNGPVPQATYTVSDGTATATATLDITVTPANDAPVAAPDVASTPEDTPVSGNVLTNDSDVDNDALTVTGFSIGGTDYAPGATADLPGVGTLVVRLDGTWTFTPAANFNGAVPQATYTVTDGTATASSTLSIDVGTINDTPVAAPDTATTPEDTPVSGNVLANDSDADPADTLKVTGFSVGGVDHAPGDTVDLAGVGTITIGLDGAWSFTPANNYSGPVPQATYTVSDGTATTTSTLDITVTPVNDAPVATPDTATTREDTPVSGNVLTNDTDVENDALSVTGFSVGGTSYAPGATATLPGVGELTIGGNGAWSFTPAANYNGPVPQATYTVSDGTDTASATLDITVTPVNDAPVAQPDAASTPEDTPVSGNVLTNDRDVDGDLLKVVGFTVGGTSYAPGDTADLPGVGTLLLRGDGSYTFTPAPDYNGPVPQVSYQVSDGTDETPGTLDITVTPVNDAPVAQDDSAITPQPVPVSGNVLTNDGDVDNDTLTVTLYSVAGVSGAVSAGTPVDIAGVGRIQLDANGAWTFTPVDSFRGLVPAVSYTVSDGSAIDTATLQIEVTPTNKPPVGTPDSGSTPEDTPISGNLLTNDTDADSDPLTVTQFSVAGAPGPFTLGQPTLIAGIGTLIIAANGDFSFQPTANYNGPVPVVNYTVSDGQASSSSTLTLNVTPVNDAPTISPDAVSVSEEGLKGGNADATGNPDTTNAASATGSLGLADVDGDTLTVTLDAPTLALSSGGQQVQWTGAGTGTLVGSVNSDSEVIRISVVNGQYTVTLKGPLDHPTTGEEDAIALDVGVKVSDGSLVSNAVLRLSIEDDSPVAARVVQSVPAGRTDTNVMLVLDISGSMNLDSGVIDPNTGNMLSRLELEKQAIDSLLSQYDALGSVQVRIVTFSTGSQAVANPNDGSQEWVDVATARQQVAGITASGFTNYDAAVNTTITAFGSPGAQQLAQNVVYFLSDGDPTAADTGPIGTPATNPDIGIQPAEEAAWQQFLVDNRATAFALGVGTDVSQPNLDPLAFDGFTGINSNALVVTDLAQLSSVLVDTVTSAVLGRLSLVTAGSGSAFGADGGHVNSLTIDGTTYLYDDANGGSVSVTGGPDRARFDTTGNTLSIDTARGGNLIVDLDDGAYRYSVPSGDRPLTEQVGYEFVDNDGDKASGSTTLALNGAVLLGDVGAEVFRWTLGDVGSPGAATSSQVGNFDPAASGGDTLDLRDLLQGENTTGGVGNLENFLEFEFDGTNTVMHVSSAGSFAGGVYTTATEDFRIVLRDVNLPSAIGLPGGSDNQVLQELLNQGKLLAGG